MQVNLDFSSMCSNRIEEIMNFARGANFKRIGIAYCITFPHEVNVKKKHFTVYFDIYTVDCKYGRLEQKDILGGNSERVLCNPAGPGRFSE